MAIDMKYFWSAETAPSGVAKALEKVNGVKEVTVNGEERTISVQFQGKCDQLHKLETAAVNAGCPALILNHCHVLVALTPIPGKPADLAKAKGSLGGLEGVSGQELSNGCIELHADLTKLTLEAIKGAVKDCGFEASVNQSYEFVTYKVVEGEYSDFAKELRARKGVMTFEEKGDNTVGLWIQTSSLKRVDIEKMAGFKVEKQ